MITQKNQNKTTLLTSISIIVIPIMVFFLLVGVSNGIATTLQTAHADEGGSLILDTRIFESVSSDDPIIFSQEGIDETFSLTYVSSNDVLSVTEEPRVSTGSEMLQGDFTGNTSLSTLGVIVESLGLQQPIYVEDSSIVYTQGTLVLPSGSLRAEVHFKTQYTRIPTVYILGDAEDEYSISSVTQKGFIVTAQHAIPSARSISWVATGQLYEVKIADNNQTVASVDVASLSEISSPIIVTDNSALPFDAEPPVITLLGENPAHIKLGGTYTDKGAYAADAISGTVPVYASIDGGEYVTIEEVFIDTSIEGAHDITYRAQDKSGNLSTVTRKVFVTTE